MIEGIERVTDLRSQGTLKILGDGEQRQGGDEALVRSRVKWLEANVLDIRNADVEPIGDSLGKVVEDLLSTIVGRHEWVVELPFEAHLTHEAVSRNVGWDALWGRNHLGQG